MTVFRSTPGSIRFEGDWTEAEARRVKGAIADVEEEGPTDAKVPAWVAYASASADLFAVSRLGLTEVASAQSVSALTDEIRRLNLSGVAAPLLSTGAEGKRR